MKHRRSVLANSANALVLALFLAGCSDYEGTPGAGGSAGTAGSAGTGGSAATGGSAGGGQAGTGGGAAGTGGMAGGGAGGTSGAAGGGAAGTSGAAGAAGGGAAGMSGAAGGDSGGMSGAAGGGAGGGGPASCDEVAACGGDVLGMWTVATCPLTVGENVDMTGFGLTCTSAPVTGSLELSGTLTLNADGTYVDDTTVTGESTLELPPSCLILSGTTTTCADISGPLGSIGYTTIVCVDNAATGGCTCEATVDQTGGLAFVSFDAGTSGNYTVADNTLTITGFGDPVDYSYCVAGDTMTMNMVTVSKTGTVMSPIVLQK